MIVVLCESAIFLFLPLVSTQIILAVQLTHGYGLGIEYVSVHGGEWFTTWLRLSSETRASCFQDLVTL